MVGLFALFACTGEDPGIKALKPDIVVEPADVLAFEPVVEEYSDTKEITIINAGAGELELGEVTIEGDDVFLVGPVDDVLEADGRFPLSITFIPKDPISYAATLTIPSNDEDTPVVEIAITGDGRVAPTPDIECTPLALDFETVGVGGAIPLWTTCENVGDDDLIVESWSQTGSGAFGLQGDPAGDVLPPGMDTTYIVMYQPTVDWGDNGRIELVTNDPDEPTTGITLVGNGGGDYEYPVAIVSGPAEAEPRTTIVVNGGDSYDPNGYEPLTYYWTVTGPYADVVTSESDYGATLNVQLDLAGSYLVELQVENTQGLRSAPALYRVDAVPTEEFHVELIWNDLPDFDLHVLTSEGALFVEPYDCNFCNPNPDWGALGAIDNPTLDLDAYSAGVENINIESPADDTYSVKVHYYASNRGGDAAATVNIYLYGALEASFSRVLAYDEVWDVADIVWPDGYVLETDTELYTQPLRTCTTVAGE